MASKLNVLKTICGYYYHRKSTFAFMKVGYNAYLEMLPPTFKLDAKFQHILKNMQGPDYLQAYIVLSNMYILFDLGIVHCLNTFEYLLDELWTYQLNPNYKSAVVYLLKHPFRIWKLYKEFLHETNQDKQDVITQLKFITQLLQDVETYQANHPLDLPL